LIIVIAIILKLILILEFLLYHRIYAKLLILTLNHFS